MKTNAELLRFYGIEIGKKYIITDQSASRKIDYKGHSFWVWQGSDNYIKIELFGAYHELAILDDLVYEKVKEPLTDKEKEYLSAVIKPFRNEIRYIVKRSSHYSEWIYFYTTDYGYDASLHFPKEKLYTGMEVDKGYTLEELGL